MMHLYLNFKNCKHFFFIGRVVVLTYLLVVVFWDCLVKWWQVRLFSQCLKSKYVPTKDNGAHAALQPRSRVWLWKFFFTCPHHVANLSKRMPAEADAWSIPSLWQLLGWCCGWDFGRGGVLFSLWFLGELLLARGRLDQNISESQENNLQWLLC